jgi:hypothetical protein
MEHNFKGELMASKRYKTEALYRKTLKNGFRQKGIQLKLLLLIVSPVEIKPGRRKHGKKR